MENAEHFHVCFIPEQIRDAIVTVKYFSNLAIGDVFVSLTDLRLTTKHLNFVIDFNDDFVSRVGIVASDVFVDLLQAIRRFCGPDYFRHESILSRTSESGTVRPLSESANPRWTIRAKASSRRISSYVLSSGCRAMMSAIDCFAVGSGDFMLLVHP